MSLRRHAEPQQVLLGAVVVEPLAEAGAVLERDPQVRVGDVEVQAALLELQLVDHEVVEQADDVGARADRVAGERLLERARAAEPLAALEHEHRLAGAGEVGGGGEAVVAAADDDDVPVLGGELGDRGGQPDLTELLGDGVHWTTSLAMASTTTAPSRWIRTGLHSSSASPSARGGDLGGDVGGVRAAAARRAACDARARCARVGGQRDDRDVVERLDVDAAEADRRAPARRRRVVTAMRSSTPGARHALDKNRGVEGVAASPLCQTACGTPRARRPRRGRRGRAADGGLVAHVGRRDLQRHGPRRALRTPRRPRPHSVQAVRPRPGRRARAAAPSPRAPRASARRRAAAARAAIARRRAASGAARPARRRPRRRCAGRRRPARPPRRTATPTSSSSNSGSVGRDHHRHRADRRAGEDALLDRLPALQRRAGDARRAVVEHQHLADRRVLADDADQVAQRLDLAPDHRRVVERVGDRRGRGQPLAQRRDRGRRERRQRSPTRAASSAPRPESPPEQVRIAGPPRARPRGARTASALASSSRSWTSAAHAAPASSTSARNTRWSPATAPVCAAAAAAPAAEAPTFSTATPTPGIGARGERLAQPRAVAVGLDEQRDRPHAFVAREVSTQSGVVTPPRCRTRSRCAAAARAASRAR